MGVSVVFGWGGSELTSFADFFTILREDGVVVDDEVGF
jgi:hypothetical protein